MMRKHRLGHISKATISQDLRQLAEKAATEWCFARSFATAHMRGEQNAVDPLANEGRPSWTRRWKKHMNRPLANDQKLNCEICPAVEPPFVF